MRATEGPMPLPDDASAPFWEACSEGRLVLQKCASCAAFRHPPRPMCPSCNSFEHTWVEASGRGRVWSWVVAHDPVLPAFKDRVPYNVAVIELDEGVRMVGNVLGSPSEEMPVEVYFEEGLPQWKPI